MNDERIQLECHDRHASELLNGWEIGRQGEARVAVGRSSTGRYGVRTSGKEGFLKGHHLNPRDFTSTNPTFKMCFNLSLD